MFARILAATGFLFLAGCLSLMTGGPLIRPGEPTGTLIIRNGTASTWVDAVLIAECSESSYGLNRLPSGVRIPPGGSYKFRLSAGCWDVKVGAVDEGKETTQRITIRAGGILEYTVE
jgi:hypothetical protein